MLFSPQEYSRDASCHELDLNGVPWTQNSSYSLHGRSMMLRLLREAHINGWRLAASADVSAKYVHQVEIRQSRMNFAFSTNYTVFTHYAWQDLYFTHRQNVFVGFLKGVTLHACGKIKRFHRIRQLFQENGPDYPADVHSWFFSYQVLLQLQTLKFIKIQATQGTTDAQVFCCTIYTVYLLCINL